MATLEEFVTEVTAEVEAQKPMMMNVNGKEEEMSDDDYDWYINVNAQARFDQQENGYKYARENSYLPLQDQLDQIWHAVDAGLFGEDAKTSDWYEDIQKVKKNAIESNAKFLITTEKDLVKIKNYNGEIPLCALKIRFIIEQKKELESYLNKINKK